MKISSVFSSAGDTIYVVVEIQHAVRMFLAAGSVFWLAIVDVLTSVKRPSIVVAGFTVGCPESSYLHDGVKRVVACRRD